MKNVSKAVNVDLHHAAYDRVIDRVFQRYKQYLGAFSSVKIPMLGIEIGYLGIQFTLARTLIALPLFIAIGYFMEWYLKDKVFIINNL